MSQQQSKYMKSWTEAYAEVRAKTEEQMGPTGVVLELSHEDWEKMQNGATLDELKSVKEYDQDHADFYAGHDPEDYQHKIGDPPTDLNLHPNSPGYRLILNNVLFPAAKKKKRRT